MPDPGRGDGAWSSINAAAVGRIIDDTATRDKSLSLANRFKLPHLSWLLSIFLMRNLCNIVVIPSRIVWDLATHFSQCSRITSQFIRYNPVSGYPVAFAQLLEEFQRRLLIPLFRKENVQFIIVLVYQYPDTASTVLLSEWLPTLEALNYFLREQDWSLTWIDQEAGTDYGVPPGYPPPAGRRTRRWRF